MMKWGDSRQFNEAGISCTAVPVFDHSGSPAYVISISTLTPRMRATGPHILAALIQNASTKIEDVLFKKRAGSCAG